MSFRIGIDVGGTFTDFLLTLDDGSSRIYKVLSSPHDPSMATMSGLEEMASDRGMDLQEFLGHVSAIVHGTTVTTNAALTYSGAKTCLLTTKGLRDTLEMRRGIREEQYNNRIANAVPLVERHLRIPIEERLDYKGDVIKELNTGDLKNASKYMAREGVEAVAICFMNAFANGRHEEEAAEVIRKAFPGLYLTVSSRLLPSIRFYDRVSTTVLNSYVGPILSRYLRALGSKLEKARYRGVLLIMQSNGGVTSPELAIERAAVTLLSGPAGGPVAGMAYAAMQGHENCITVDMGGTSFDASLIKDRNPTVTTTGEINRLKLALPMLNVVTIGAGGGSIGWIDDGGLLRMGPRSAGADPGPACYGLGGEWPTCTDADLLLGYLDRDYFAGGRIPLNPEKARKAIAKYIAGPLGIEPEEAAAGMYNLINVNMAAAVREVSVKQGHDPRDFPLVVAGGAGPNHACMIALELDIPVMIVPRESSIFCAAGMLMSDLKHDFVRTYTSLIRDTDIVKFRKICNEMKTQGSDLLKSEGMLEEKIESAYSLDLRYARQYHEVNVEITADELEKGDFEAMASRFHHQHNKLYGYSLEKEDKPVELINIRLVCVGRVDKPRFQKEPFAGSDPSAAFKGKRKVYLPGPRAFSDTDVFDGLKLKHGNKIEGPAVLEQVHTTTFVTPEFNVLVDSSGSYTLYLKSREKEIVQKILRKSG